MRIHYTIRGFTLLELLVVIAIIGLLTSVVLASLSVSRAKARDTQRVQSPKELQKAVELYYAHRGYYPPVDSARSGNVSNVCADGTRGEADWCTFLNEIQPYYPGNLKDPLGDTQIAYRYYYDSDTGDGNSTYGLMTLLETSAGEKFSDSDGGVYCSLNAPTGTCLRSGFRGYELGQQPALCQSQGITNWYGGTSANPQPVCP